MVLHVSMVLQYWAFSDLRTGRVLTKMSESQHQTPLTCAQLHPDGLIFGTGRKWQGMIRMRGGGGEGTGFSPAPVRRGIG